MPGIMSAAPARAKNSATSQMLGIRPAIAIIAPYAAAASTIARPWWLTRAVQPLEPRSRPAAPTTRRCRASRAARGARKTRSASAGNSTTGAANIIA